MRIHRKHAGNMASVESVQLMCDSSTDRCADPQHRPTRICSPLVCLSMFSSFTKLCTMRSEKQFERFWDFFGIK